MCSAAGDTDRLVKLDEVDIGVADFLFHCIRIDPFEIPFGRVHVGCEQHRLDAPFAAIQLHLIKANQFRSLIFELPHGLLLGVFSLGVLRRLVAKILLRCRFVRSSLGVGTLSGGPLRTLGGIFFTAGGGLDVGFLFFGTFNGRIQLVLG